MYEVIKFNFNTDNFDCAKPNFGLFTYVTAVKDKKLHKYDTFSKEIHKRDHFGIFQKSSHKSKAKRLLGVVCNSAKHVRTRTESEDTSRKFLNCYDLAPQCSIQYAKNIPCVFFVSYHLCKR
jgi:hypothetical protein